MSNEERNEICEKAWELYKLWNIVPGDSIIKPEACFEVAENFCKTMQKWMGEKRDE